MKHALLEEEVEALPIGALTRLLNNFSKSDKDFANALEMVVSSGSGRVVSAIQMELRALSELDDYLEPCEVKGLVRKIDGLTEAIVCEVLPESPREAERLIRVLYELHPTVFELSVDRSDSLWEAFVDVLDCWSTVWEHVEDRTPAEVVACFWDCVLDDPYDIGRRALDHFFDALGPQGVAQLEAEARSYQESDPDAAYVATQLLMDIADAQGDVDKYISAVSCEHTKGDCSEYSIMEISRRLIDAHRSFEALTWLEKGDPSRTRNLRIQALMDIGNTKEALKELWIVFTARPALSTFQAIAICDRNPEAAWLQALDVASQHKDLHDRLSFFYETNEWDRLIETVSKYHESLNGDSYPLLKPIARALETRAPVEASLLYRALAEPLIERAASKYYDIAVGYVSKLAKLNSSIDRWKEHSTHEWYMQGLRERHGRKRSLWARLASKGIS